MQRQKLLEKIALQVQPVMKKHQWTVQLLSELPPTSTGRLWVLLSHARHAWQQRLSFLLHALTDLKSLT